MSDPLFDLPPFGPEFEQMHEQVDELVRAQLSRYLGELERACEEALVTGTHGVRVTHHSPDWRVGGDFWQIEITEEVPWGHIEDRWSE